MDEQLGCDMCLRCIVGMLVSGCELWLDFFVSVESSGQRETLPVHIS